jgi:hypothetical protein
MIIPTRVEVYDALQDLACARGWTHKQDISRGYYPGLLQYLCSKGIVSKKIKKYNQHFYKITFKGLWTLHSRFGKI